MADIILDFQDVCFRYEADEDETPLPLCVKHVNLQIEKGSFTVILGHNGSGKSTLAKLSNSILDSHEIYTKIHFSKGFGHIERRRSERIGTQIPFNRR